MFSSLIRLFAHLTKHRRIQLAAALMIMLVSGLAEVFSLAAILPFLTVITNPKLLWDVPLVQYSARYLGITTSSDLLVPATLFFVLAALFAAFVRLSNLWLNGRLAAAI